MAAKAQLISIQLPDQKVTKLNVNSNTTVGEVADILYKQINKDDINPGDEFGITMDEIVFDKNSKIAKIPANQLSFRKTLFTVQIRIHETKRTEIFALDPLLTVKDAILFIEHSNLKANTYNVQTRPPTDKNTPNHNLQLFTNPDRVDASGGITMEYGRTLLSYRIKPENVLILSSVQSKSAAFASQGDLTIIITCKEHNLQKAFKYPPNTKYAEVIVKFLEKANLKEPKWFFGMFINVAGEYVHLLPEWDLQAFPLPTPAKLECKYLVNPPTPLFGVDPLILEFVLDNGFHVPKILVILKEMLLLSDGIEQEGVFRKSGLESEMTYMKEELNSGRHVVCDNTHSIGTMMKRWYKELPKRLFSHIGADFADDERMTKVEEILTPLEQSLFFWLMDLLVDVATKSDVNKMTPSNLGIVWGPGMTGSNNDSVLNEINSGIMDSFADTRLGISIIEKNVSKFLNRSTPIPRIDLSDQVTINTSFTPSSSSSSSSSSNQRGAVPTVVTGEVLYDNVAEKDGEISAIRGTQVVIVQDSGDWLYVSANGQQGYLPRNYVKINDPPSSSSAENTTTSTTQSSESSSSPSSSADPNSKIGALSRSLDLKNIFVPSMSDLRTNLRTTGSKVDILRPSSSSSTTGTDEAGKRRPLSTRIPTVPCLPVSEGIEVNRTRSNTGSDSTPEASLPRPVIPPKPAAFATKSPSKPTPIIPPKPSSFTSIHDYTNNNNNNNNNNNTNNAHSMPVPPPKPRKFMSTADLSSY